MDADPVRKHSDEKQHGSRSHGAHHALHRDDSRAVERINIAVRISADKRPGHALQKHIKKYYGQSAFDMGRAQAHGGGGYGQETKRKQPALAKQQKFRKQKTAKRLREKHHRQDHAKHLHRKTQIHEIGLVRIAESIRGGKNQGQHRATPQHEFVPVADLDAGFDLFPMPGQGELPLGRTGFCKRQDRERCQKKRDSRG